MEDFVDFDKLIKAVNDMVESNREKLLKVIKNANVITNDMVEKIIDILTESTN